MKSALVLLTLDEIEALRKMWDRLPLRAADEAFAVDGGSTDGTVEFLESKGLTVVTQGGVKGRGAAIRSALAVTDAQILCFFSPDGNEDPADVPRLLELVREGADLAIASRMMPGAFNEEDASLWRPRKWVSRLFTAAANARWGGRLTDASNGLRAVRRDALRGLSADGFSIEYEMTIKALKRGLAIAETPTREGTRLGGRTKAASWPTGWAFLKQLAAEL